MIFLTLRITKLCCINLVYDFAHHWTYGSLYLCSFFACPVRYRQPLNRLSPPFQVGFKQVRGLFYAILFKLKCCDSFKDFSDPSLSFRIYSLDTWSEADGKRYDTETAYLVNKVKKMAMLLSIILILDSIVILHFLFKRHK